jgi:hypothetical protein
VLLLLAVEVVELRIGLLDRPLGDGSRELEIVRVEIGQCKGSVGLTRTGTAACTSVMLNGRRGKQSSEKMSIIMPSI